MSKTCKGELSEGIEKQRKLSELKIEFELPEKCSSADSTDVESQR